MYYYIMETPRGKVVGLQEKVKDILANLGIAGETAFPSAARTIEELTHLGVVKGYSTIVAVGSETLVNKVMSSLITEKLNQEVVLGVIPTNYDSLLSQIIGVTDPRSACEALKFRKLASLNLGLVEPNRYFVTEAIIESNRPEEIFFSYDQVQGKLYTNRICIKPGLKVYVEDRSKDSQATSKLMKWFLGKKEKDSNNSFFHSDRFHFESEQRSIQVKIDNETVAKTPVTIRNQPRTLKFVVMRDKIQTKQ